ncbi:MAG TPA: hypothetical protein PLH19_01495 [Anaerolineae bacterium]|nr:hypothetical protein [Anaerolineae bacterium]HQH37197.1 hypothetical protein [Anaerolineae bacterium]
MPISYVRYDLHDGYIHNWLVVGPQAILVEDLDRFTGSDYKLQIARHYYTPEHGITEQPVEPGPLTEGVVQMEGFEGHWRYVCCLDDHFVDLTTFQHLTHYLRAWAYTEIESPAARDVTFVLTTHGPADVWLDDEHVHRHEHFHHQPPHSVTFTAHLSAGRHRLLVRFEAVAARACPYAMALRLLPLATADDAVYLPTTIAPVERRNTLEEIFAAAYLTQDVFDYDAEFVIRWPLGMPKSAEIVARLHTPDGRIYGEGKANARAGKRKALGKVYEYPTGALRLTLMPPLTEYYEGNMRITRTLDVWGLGLNRYHETPYATYAERCREGLMAAARLEASIFSEIAKMAVDWWQYISVKVILETIDDINHRQDCSDFFLVGLLGMVYRFGDDPRFPQELKLPIETCILNFKYWHDEPGSDAMAYATENHSILFHTAEILAGQLYPDRLFSNAGQSGQWHREKGERLALEWLHERGVHGFKEWDSNCYFEEDILALSHLIDLAASEPVWEMATVLMDKMLFSIAVNSYKGVFGSTHGRTYAPLIKGAYLEGTSGITNVLWGMGVFNDRIMGTVSVACMQNYELPSLIAAIAADLPDEMWNRERHVGEAALWQASGSLGDEVNKVTYKTPDFMLSSAQDYHPGERGFQQHIWQATFGPAAVVFVTHPPCMSEDGSHRPNFWHGNVILPRVAQWKDVLIAIHKLPDDDWLGFTHAYFPIYAFDDGTLRDDAHGRTWAFARQGNGYLALTASQGLTLMTAGLTAHRELRSYGSPNVWLCHLGRAALDGDFKAFQEQILALDVAFDGLSVQMDTLRGDKLAFGWEGPLRRNGVAEPITGFQHYENPYCVANFPVKEMYIGYGDQAMRLKFEEEGEEG